MPDNQLIDLRPEPEMRSFEPSLRDQLVNFFSRQLGDTRQSHRRASKLMDVLDLTPVGAATAAHEAGRMIGRGAQSGDPSLMALGATEAILAAIPGVKAGPLKKGLLRRQKMAETMEKAGRSADEIWTTTRLERDADGEWRFEIPDTGAKFKLGDLKTNERPRRLGEIMEHPELYEHFPETRRMKVGRRDLGARTKGYYQEATSGAPAHIMLGETASPETLLHETQHAISPLRGGSPEEFERAFIDAQVRAEFEIGRLEMAMKSGLNNLELRAPGSGAWVRVRGKDKLRALHDGFKQLIRADPSKAAWEKYRRLAGEVESRNVEARYRQGLTAEVLGADDYLATTPPVRTEDVPRSMQEVRRR